MPDKNWKALNELDRALRRAFGPVGPGNEGKHCVIEMHSGFELFNNRPYHNYETWGTGYHISTPDGEVSVWKEDLDDAIYLFIEKLEEYKEDGEKKIVSPNSSLKPSKVNV